MGLLGRREAISAPTVGYASESTPVSTARTGPDLSPGTPKGTSTVRKLSKRASAMSAAHAAHSDQATRAAARRPILPTPRPRSLVPLVTIITLASPSPKPQGGRYFLFAISR